MPRQKRKRHTQNRNYRLVLISAVILIFIAFVLLWGYDWMKQRNATRVKFEAFGIELPSRYDIHGIDVSKYQQTIAWDNVKAMHVENTHLDFVFIKATEGVSNKDVFFKRNWERSKKAGMIRGAYHFFIASRDAGKQAAHFINTVDLEMGDLPPVLDVEQKNGKSAAHIRKEVKRWLDIVEEHYQVKPIIYTNVDFYNKNLGPEFDEYPLWVAHYFQPNGPRINRPWVLWQHSERGRVNGIKHYVDFNVFNGDIDALKNLLVR